MVRCRPTAGAVARRSGNHADTAARVAAPAAAQLPARVSRSGSPDRPTTLVHGDWHLGQLGRLSVTRRWLLIDVDDLGVGDPAWDLARPAGFWAAGLIPDDDWAAFLQSYRAAVPPGDPWPARRRLFAHSG